MTRSFVWIDGVCYERGVDELPSDPRELRSQKNDGILWGDRHYDGQRTPAGDDISTRTKHRDYMRRNGLTTADDYTQQWAADRKARVDALTTGGDHAGRRADVIRAAQYVTEQVRRGRR